MFDFSINFLSKAQLPTSQTDYVQAIDKQRHYRRCFDSSIEEFLTMNLNDIKQSEFIYQKYKEIIFPAMESHPEALHAFEAWLQEVYISLLIGCNTDQLKDNTLLRPHLPVIEKFVKACNQTEKLPQKKYKKIAIIIPNAPDGVGEVKVAEALESSLKSQGYEVKIIMLNRQADLLNIFSRMSEEDVWTEICQKKHGQETEELEKKCWKFRSELARYIPNDGIGALRRAVDEFAPDFVISTRYCEPLHATLAIKRPLAFIHCDYTFNEKLREIATKVDNQRVKFWVPSKECIPKELVGRVDVLGYPLRLGIQRKGKEEVNSYLKKWNIHPGDKVVMMQMGRQGVGGYLPKLIQTIITSNEQLSPTTFVVITGKNKTMKHQIQELLAKAPTKENIRVQLYDSLNEQEMNELYNMASVMIGKSGGVVTAEAIHMGIPSLVFPSWQLEEANSRHLVKINLGEELKDPKDVVTQLKSLLKRDKVNTSVVDWQQQLQSLLHSYQIK